MSRSDRFPDAGDVPGCRVAAWALEDAAQQLAERRTSAVTAAGSLTGDVWSGQAAQAFLTAATSVSDTATATAEGWLRLSQAIAGYATALEQLQAEGDTIRLRLDSAQDLRTGYQRQLTAAQEQVTTGNATAGGSVGSLSFLVAEAQQSIDRELSALADLADQRRALDARTVNELQGTPGPGAAAWAGLAYRPNGSIRPPEDIVDDLLDRINDADGRTAEDYDLVARFLAQYSSDPDVMAAFYAGLGPEGLAGFMAEFSTAGDLHGAFHGGVTAAQLSGLLCTGWVTASLTWDTDTARQWGEGLIDTADGYARGLVVPFLLAADGLNPQVAVGAFTRVEQLRTEDPERFALVTRTGGLPTIDFLGYTRAEFEAGVLAGLGGGGPTLMGAIFGQLARVPGEALGLLEGAAGAFWFGEWDWSPDGFEGPAAVIQAIVTSPEAVDARAQDPMGATWGGIVDFASQAFERLGGNLHLQVGAMSPEASRDIALAMGVFVPEVVSGMGNLGSFEGDRITVEVLIGGVLVEVPALATSLGNLSRLLGIATTDVSAAAAFGGRITDYTDRVLTHLTGSGHPNDTTAEKLLAGLGGLYGMTYASASAEAGHHAELIDGQAREELDFTMRLIGAIPGLSTGTAAVDWLAQVALGNIDLLAESQWSALMTPGELAALRESGMGQGESTLSTAITDKLTEAWPRIDPPYGTTLGTLTKATTDEYGDKATALNAGVTSSMYDVLVINENGEIEARNRGDMP
ncbi:hypothetical protein [Cellulomonas denverensis]|uniref:Uncharacterized protein n=1 Tax=Cellulomonas denverensis TaxID=264297 RepID=A0A7X6KS71_9CELL|nr:hypothetical protein [Cellulomonas denverensis]NKY21301.1 hypothetical protein [Cellulomonas denverensis]GIG24594.1 hypothetical protein Cde04nite_08380 [Cellulomonas denverensis]